MIRSTHWLSRCRNVLVGAVVLGTLALVGCGSASSSVANTPTDTPAATAPTATTGATGAAMITMGAFSFSHNTATVKAGQAVTFNDPASGGGTHNLVTGHGGTFTAAAGAPTEFATSSGLSFSAGDSKSVVFPTAGTYSITCTIHPSMQATITVTP
ncbi:MAG TPA: plastocyanin/azurin family copper-binding protein [Ktedonobacterales bacterium]|nr:plastocyanin/azurin family copper-binding protein [Ktedonobacterales bacterium]